MIDSRSQSEPARRRRSKRSLVVLSLTLACAVLALATRDAWMTSHPAAAAARRMHDHQASKRITAIRELERFGREDPGTSIGALTAGMRDSDPEVRVAAATALVMPVHAAMRRHSARFDVERAVVALFDSVKDPRAEVRAAGLAALWMIASVWDGSATAVAAARVEPVLLEAAADFDPAVRIAALSGLGAIGPTIGDDPKPVLAAALEDNSPRVRAVAAESLVHFSKGLPRTLASLVRSFEAARPEFRPAYVNVLKRIRPPVFKAEAVDALAGALASSDDEIRCLAADSLASFGDGASTAVGVLVSSMRRSGRKGAIAADGQDPVLACARAIATITAQHALLSKPRPTFDPQTLPALSNVLHSALPQTRAAVATAIGRLQPIPSLVPMLGQAVGDPDAAVRAAALRALHDIGDMMPFSPPETVTLALDDRSPEVRYWAAGALGHAGRGIDPSVPALLYHAEHDADPEVRLVCAEELEDFIKPPAVTPAVLPILTKALESPARRVRAAACALLGRLGPASVSAIPAIFDLLKGGAGQPSSGASIDRDVRINEQAQAATALSKLAPGTPHANQAATAIAQALQAEPTGWPAARIPLVRALARFGPLARAALPRLRELERAPDEHLRDSARQAVASIDPVN